MITSQYASLLRSSLMVVRIHPLSEIILKLSSRRGTGRNLPTIHSNTTLPSNPTWDAQRRAAKRWIGFHDQCRLYTTARNQAACTLPGSLSTPIGAALRLDELFWQWPGQPAALRIVRIRHLEEPFKYFAPESGVYTLAMIAAR